MEIWAISACEFVKEIALFLKVDLIFLIFGVLTPLLGTAFWLFHGCQFFINGGSGSAKRKPQPSIGKLTIPDNPSQLRLESSVPAWAGFELTSVLTG